MQGARAARRGRRTLDCSRFARDASLLWCSRLPMFWRKLCLVRSSELGLFPLFATVSPVGSGALVQLEIY